MHERTLHRRSRFPCLNRIEALKRKRHIVQTFEQRRPLVGRDVEAAKITGRTVDLACLEIDRERFMTVRSNHLTNQFIHRTHVQGNGQNAVLQTVLPKELGLTMADDASDAKGQQRPNCVLPRTSTAEVAAHHEDRRSSVARFLKHEIVIATSIGPLPHVREQAF